MKSGQLFIVGTAFETPQRGRCGPCSSNYFNIILTLINAYTDSILNNSVISVLRITMLF